MKDIGSIENFLTQQEIDWFVWYWHQLPTKADNGQRIYSLTHFDQSFFSRMYQLLNNKIKKSFPNEVITTVNLNWDYLPGGIHSDGYLEYDKNDKIAKTYLVPLVMEKNEYHTVLFDQTSQKAVTLNRELGLGDNGIVTYEQVSRQYFDQLSDYPFDRSVYEKYLQHLNYENLRGLSTIAVHQWKIGKAMYWPRQQLHCSANFDHNQVRSSLLIVTRYVE